ncbi:DeoR/GlpR family DNA-binding transcription regulator [Salsipaludibacter albus]|uniref:DeoR/GlpR family DNA-binding transcription regulator n=1 Tax=Salsipaludibacter albus TaxID=2849650 RepID=UPI001EE3E278|nr:DeoR/GlpR family DNA-binding transcription regulator [Salsipaludibacter albus]MBY5164504.1 DeoR/GlpR family DNA-binding transcription regulator [Salsipaludibacter albus]
MYAEERQQAIAEWVSRHGRAAVTQLADRFDVTPETVRRDLDRLEEHGLVRRVHGGAVPATAITVLETDVDSRQHEQAEQKQRIAARAVALLPSGGSIVLDAGTTTSRLLDGHRPDEELTVVTNSIPIALRLTQHEGVNLTMVGGRVRGTTHAVVGPEAVAHLAGLRVDVAFLGTNGLTEGFGASTPDPDEAAAKTAMVDAAHQVVVLADATKLGREHLHRFARPDQVDVLVTDTDANPARVAALETAGITVVLA